jgi:uncharacterized protein (TIGR02453 family)
MIRLVDAINRDLSKDGPQYVTDPAKAIYRIYRDTRFNPNKAPYKTHIGALLWDKRLDKNNAAGLYFHLSAKEVLIAGGVYKPLPEVLLAIRQHIADHHERLRAILRRKAIREKLGELQGESLNRPPKGWCADHPAIDLLKRKDLLLEITLKPSITLGAGMLDEVSKCFRLMLPFIEFLNEPQLKRRAQPRDPLLWE